MGKGQWAEAAALLGFVMEREQRGSEAWAIAASMLGECLTRLGRLEDAAPLLEEAHQVLERDHGVLDRDHGSPAWRESVRRRMEHCQLRGDLYRAADLHIQLVMDDRLRGGVCTSGESRGPRDAGDQGGGAWPEGWSEVPQQ